MNTITQHLVGIVSTLRGAAISIPSVGVYLPILELLHAILIGYTYRTALSDSHSEIGWGQGLLATIVMAAGGGSTVSLIRGDPMGILKDNRFWCLYPTVYWLMFSNSYIYGFLQRIFAIPFVEEIFAAADGVKRAAGVVKFGVDAVSLNPELGPDKWAAKIICGSLAGCGGGLWVGK
ncbi:hypothetical protein BX666DRAFT_1848277 [Dichotomocladium elegans]|nr:hypothetical protein BX666DRAFT_1848277 [Dichotomocladium elegans]